MPDRWAAVSPGWWLLPAVGTGLGLLLVALGQSIASLAGKHPNLVNIPRKQEFLALDEAGRRWVLLPMRWLLHGLALALSLLFAYLQHGTFRVAVGGAATLDGWPVFAFLGVTVAATVWLTLVTRRRIGEAASRRP